MAWTFGCRSYGSPPIRTRRCEPGGPRLLTVGDRRRAVRTVHGRPPPTCLGDPVPRQPRPVAAPTTDWLESVLEWKCYCAPANGGYQASNLDGRPWAVGRQHTLTVGLADMARVCPLEIASWPTSKAGRRPGLPAVIARRRIALYSSHGLLCRGNQAVMSSKRTLTVSCRPLD
jgi:hypothetical protein